VLPEIQENIVVTSIKLPIELIEVQHKPKTVVFHLMHRVQEIA
jgi:hypothetical protein